MAESSSAAASIPHIFRIQQIYASAAYSVLVWDWLVSLSSEYKVMWRSSWSVIKVLYILARYFTLGACAFLLWTFHGQVDHNECSRIVRLIPGLGGIVVIVSQLILAYRTWNVFRRSRFLLAVMIALIVVEIIFLILGAVMVGPSVPEGASGICVPFASHSGMIYAKVYFTVPFFTDAILLGLCIYATSTTRPVRNYKDVLAIFERDGLIYFVVTTLFTLLQAAFFLQPNRELQNVNALPFTCFTGIMACRLAVSLQRSIAAQSSSTSGASCRKTMSSSKGAAVEASQVLHDRFLGARFASGSIDEELDDGFEGPTKTIKELGHAGVDDGTPVSVPLPCLTRGGAGGPAPAYEYEDVVPAHALGDSDSHSHAQPALPRRASLAAPASVTAGAERRGRDADNDFMDHPMAPWNVMARDRDAEMHRQRSSSAGRQKAVLHFKAPPALPRRRTGEVSP